jgi:hypothetical protein
MVGKPDRIETLLEEVGDLNQKYRTPSGCKPLYLYVLSSLRELHSA